MAETKKITTLYVVTDSETSYDNIGDIEGGLFDEEWLKRHIGSHGESGLLNRLSWMIGQVIACTKDVNREKQSSQTACVNISNIPKYNEPNTGL